MSTPVFVDLNGSTARVDPQRSPAGYIKLSVFTEQALDDAGNIVHRGQVAEVYIKPAHADALAQALWNSHGEPEPTAQFAPEMLEVLKHIVYCYGYEDAELFRKFCETDMTNDEIDSMREEAISKARAVIAKATGDK